MFPFYLPCRLCRTLPEIDMSSCSIRTCMLMLPRRWLFRSARSTLCSTRSTYRIPEAVVVPTDGDNVVIGTPSLLYVGVAIYATCMLLHLIYHIYVLDNEYYPGSKQRGSHGHARCPSRVVLCSFVLKSSATVDRYMRLSCQLV